MIRRHSLALVLGLAALHFAPAGAQGHALTYRDLNFERRLGWKEVVVTASGGARVESSDVPATSASNWPC